MIIIKSLSQFIYYYQQNNQKHFYNNFCLFQYFIQQTNKRIYYLSALEIYIFVGQQVFLCERYTKLQRKIKVQALGLPSKFLFKNLGGGIINPSSSERLLTVVHAAKTKKIRELKLQINDPKTGNFVAYYSKFCHKSAEKALILKDIYHQRVIPCFYNYKTKNFEICADNFQKLILDDLQKGLIPFFFHGTYGSTFMNSIDLSEEVLDVSKKYKIWLSLDAVSLGSSWIVEQNRPEKELLEPLNSILINFSKNLLVGNGGALLFVADKDFFSNLIIKKKDAIYYQNHYTGEDGVTDYMNWTVGLDRRVNVLKFYFLFEYYGLEKLQQLVKNICKKTQYFQQLIQQCPDLFEVFSKKYSLLCLQVKHPVTHKACDALTHQVIVKIKNSEFGYCTPGQLNQYTFIRMNFSNIFTTEKDLQNYFQEIKRVTLQIHEQLLESSLSTNSSTD